MDSIERTLQATQNLLCALEQEGSLMNDEYFIEKLAYIRSKHKETAEFLNRAGLNVDPNILKTYHSSPGCHHYIDQFRQEDRQRPTIDEHHHCHHQAQPHQAMVQYPIHHVSRQASLEQKITQLKNEYEHDEPGRHPTYQRDLTFDYPRTRPIVIDANEIYRRELLDQTRRGKRLSESDRQTFYGQSEVVQESDISESSTERTKNHTKEKNTGIDGKRERESRKDIHDRSQNVSKSKSTTDLRQFNKNPSGGEESVKGKITVPKPFSLTTRKIITNSYSQKFVKEMMEEKKREQQEEEKEVKSAIFKASIVPNTTYLSDNPRVREKKYIQDLQKRIRIGLKKHQMEDSLKRKTKSLGDLAGSGIARPVPLSTYVAPPMKNYRREKSASQRAIRLLTEASTPPGMKEHTVRSNVAFRLRHEQCYDYKDTSHLWRNSVPDFAKLHQQLQYRLESAVHKPSTIPRPFHFTEPKKGRHKECLSSSPPRHRPSSMRRVSHPDVPIRSTHSSLIRANAIRKQIDAREEDASRSRVFWEERKEGQEEHLHRIRSNMGRTVTEDIEILKDEKLKNMREHGREYEHQLAEMRERVLARPLVMERQTTLAQTQNFERKYKQRLEAVGKIKSQPRSQSANRPQTSAVRRASEQSGGTYSVASVGVKEGEADYREEFDSDDSTSSPKEKSKKASSSLSKSKNSGTSSSSSSVSSSMSSTKSSRSSSNKGNS